MAIERLSEHADSNDSSPYRPPMVELSRVELTPQHGLVTRIIRSTIFSLWFPPLAFYTLCLLIAVFNQGRPPRRVYVVMAVNYVIAALAILSDRVRCCFSTDFD